MGMSLTGRDQPYKDGFGPFAPGVFHADFPYAYRDDSDESRPLAHAGADADRRSSGGIRRRHHHRAGAGRGRLCCGAAGSSCRRLQ